MEDHQLECHIHTMGQESVRSYEFENISYTSDKVAKYMKKTKIKPGTDRWFRLWFAKPFLTGEDPYGKKKK